MKIWITSPDESSWRCWGCLAKQKKAEGRPCLPLRPLEKGRSNMKAEYLTKLFSERVVRAWNKLLSKVVQSPSLEVLKNHANVVPGDTV